METEKFIEEHIDHQHSGNGDTYLSMHESEFKDFVASKVEEAEEKIRKEIDNEMNIWKKDLRLGTDNELEDALSNRAAGALQVLSKIRSSLSPEANKQEHNE